MSEKRLDYDLLWNNYYQVIELDDGDTDYLRRLSPTEIIKRLNEQQATIEHLTKSRDKWSKSAKLHSEYFDCLEKAIEIAYEEKPYPKMEDIMNIYSKLEKEIDDE